jgi:hypothetical protein
MAAKPLHLPDVTLLGVDTASPDRLEAACAACTEHIEFGAVRLITDAPIRSVEDYSEWMCTQLYAHVPTSHVLVFQWDGYVKNWQAWDDAWLQFDYIGAPWAFPDGLNVGNGGFSLRSRRLMEVVATDPAIRRRHPEDRRICRDYRPHLEQAHGIRFAPEDVARRFSIEGYGQANRTHTTEFGFHGVRVKFAPPPKAAPPARRLSPGSWWPFRRRV